MIEENRKLDESQKHKALELTREQGITCKNCGCGNFTVGEALELGRLWYNEEHGAFMVALRCGNCRTPTGIRLHHSEFL